LGSQSPGSFSYRTAKHRFRSGGCTILLRLHASRLSISANRRTDTPPLPAGPTVLPGTYTVQLTVDEKTSNAPLTIQDGPAHKISTAGLEKKFRVETRMASILTESGQALLQAARFALNWKS